MQDLAFSLLRRQWSITALPATEGPGAVDTGGEDEDAQQRQQASAAS